LEGSGNQNWKLRILLSLKIGEQRKPHFSDEMLPVIRNQDDAQRQGGV
jgi:hypothetical protein